MTRSPARTRLLAVGAAAALVLAACSSSKTSSGSSGGASAPSKIPISTIGSYLTIFSPLWAAEPDLDAVAQKFHTKFSYQPFSKGGDALTALLGGSVQMAAGASAAQALKAAAQGKKLSYVANIFSGGGVVLVGAKKYESERGTDLAKYAGGSWGYTSEGSSSQLFMQASAEHAGLNWDKQKHVALGGVAAYEPSLQSGRADIVSMDSGAAAKSVQDGIGYVVLNTNDATQFDPIAGKVLDNGLIFTNSFRQKYPQLVEAIVTAFIKGLLKVRAVTDPNQAYDLLPATFQKAHPDKAQFAVEWQLSQPAFAQTDGSSSADAIANTSKISLKPDQIDSEGVKQLYDNSLVDAAYKSLNVPRPTLPAGN